MKFGKLLYKYRMRKKLSLRKFARELDISPVYIMDIEKGKRAAPRKEILDKMVKILELKEGEIVQFYDEAAETKKEDFIPADIKDVFKEINNAAILMRAIKKKKLTTKNVENLIKDIENGKYSNEGNNFELLDKNIQDEE